MGFLQEKSHMGFLRKNLQMRFFRNKSQIGFFKEKYLKRNFSEGNLKWNFFKRNIEIPPEEYQMRFPRKTLISFEISFGNISFQFLWEQVTVIQWADTVMRKTKDYENKFWGRYSA